MNNRERLMPQHLQTAPRVRQCLKIATLAAAMLIAVGVQAEAQQQLSAEEISSEIIGQRFQGKKGIMSVTLHYAKNGSMTIETPVGAGKGTWEMAGDQLCVTVMSGPRKGSECLSFSRRKNGGFDGSNGIRLTPLP